MVISNFSPPNVEEETIESALVPPRSGDIGTPPPQEQDQSHMQGSDGKRILLVWSNIFQVGLG